MLDYYRGRNPLQYLDVRWEYPDPIVISWNSLRHDFPCGIQWDILSGECSHGGPQ